ncbi:hypothetical protein PVK06_024933 [Gossypium arboreum]|uniref:Uncharacterized protein n=1 Tax=Gossypium arboreum TaxID=29729 RepID=A0ABR0PFP0_GOSAR|nr:hypothetical protein PVK06_024933 [Gossypium arboreum]
MVLDSDNEESMKDIVVGDLEYELVTLDLQTYLCNIIRKKAMLDRSGRVQWFIRGRHDLLKSMTWKETCSYSSSKTKKDENEVPRSWTIILF